MSEFVPFAAVRPPRDKVHVVASRSYISYTKRALESKLLENPYSFIHIINPYFIKGIARKLGMHEKNKLVREVYDDFKKDAVLLADERPMFYIYRQLKGNHESMGVIGGCSAKEYLDGKIKIHEKTLTQREELFKDYLEEVGFNAEPVLLTFKEDASALEQIFDEITNMHDPYYDFTNTDRIRHQLWPVDDMFLQSRIRSFFQNVANFYIADGHHRTASSALLYQNHQSMEIGKKNVFEFFMGLVVPKKYLNIYSFARLIKDLKGFSLFDFKSALLPHFEITESEDFVTPLQSGDFCVFVENTYLYLRLKKTPKEKGLKRLDAYILNELILGPILHIEDLKTDKRIAYEGGEGCEQRAVKLVQKKKFEMAIFLYPAAVDTLFDIADKEEIMPPKSTWVEPKLRSGLTIYELR